MARPIVAVARRLPDFPPGLAAPCSRASAWASSRARLATARDSVTRFDTWVRLCPDGFCPSGSSTECVCCFSFAFMGSDLHRAGRLRGTR